MTTERAAMITMIGMEEEALEAVAPVEPKLEHLHLDVAAGHHLLLLLLLLLLPHSVLES